jgi:transcriptional regulator with XRE-family HTH domain
MDLDTPAKRLRWVRENRSNYSTGTDAARAFGWTVSTYLGHENGDRQPSVKAAKRYAAAFKVPWAWILDGGRLDPPLVDNQPTPKDKTQRVFISHSSDSVELAARLLNKIYELPATSDEKASVITVLQWLKKAGGAS